MKEKSRKLAPILEAMASVSQPQSYVERDWINMQAIFLRVSLHEEILVIADENAIVEFYYKNHYAKTENAQKKVLQKI